MPWLAALVAGITGAFGRLIATRVGMWGVSILGFLGLSLAVQTVVMDQAVDLVNAHMAGVSGDLARWLGVLKIDRYVSVVISAYTVATVKKVFLARKAVA